MKLRFAVCMAVLIAFAGFVRGQGADERYIQIYNVMQEADALNAGGQVVPAITRYREALAGLRNLQTNYPGWQEKVVKYRLGYIESKLAVLEPKAPTPAPGQTNATPGSAMPSTSAQTNLAEAPVPPTAVNQAMQEQLQALQAEIRRLGEENGVLQQKVKEALKVQPAATDPRELTKAEEKIRELQKQVDLLKASVDQGKSAASDSKDVQSSTQSLNDLKKQLSQQAKLVDSLRKDNLDLKRQNEKIKQQASRKKSAISSEKVNELNDQLAVAQTTISALQATNTALRAELLVLEKRLAAGQPGDVASQLANTIRRLETEVEVVRARLEVYESKPVPYTPEELALFKQPDVKMAVSQTNGLTTATNGVTARKTYAPPPGTGSLFYEAQRAAESSRYEEAEQKYQQILRQDENNVFTLSHLAAVQMDLKRYEDAEKSLRQALSQDAQDPASLLLLGRLKFLQERYDEALDALSRSASVVPNDALTQYFLGKTLIQKGNRQQGEKALRKAVQLKPNWGEAHYSLAIVYATQQPPFKELAQWHYEKALRGGVTANPDLEKIIRNASAAPSAQAQ